MLFVSTKNEMLGKENRKEKGHRRYSLLLLALLFIGFASYGTYAYFSNSTSTSKAHLTLNGMSQNYNVGGNTGGKTDTQTGDGTTNVVNDTNPDNNDKYVPGTDAEGNGNGQFVTVTEDDAEATNSNKFGEFDWVYIGNTKGEAIEPKNLLKETNTLSAFNKYITSSDEITSSNEVEGATNNVVGAIFNNVVGGDVFRKTVRLKVEGEATVPVKTTLNWAANDKDDAGLNNVIAGVFVKRGELKNGIPKEQFIIDDKYLPAITEVTNRTAYTHKDISVKPGQYLDIEIVVMVKNNVDLSQVANLNLAKIARQLSVRLEQNISANDNTSVLGSR